MDSLRQAHGSTSLTDHDIETVIQMATSASRPSPTPLKDTRTQLFVGNLPYRVRWQDLKDLFRRAGTVLRADVSLGPDNRSRGYGTVLLATAEDAGRAIDMFNGYSWQTRILEVRQDRLPPDFDLNLPPSSISTGSMSLEDLDYPPEFHHGALYRTLFVGNLPFHCQWQDLKDLFRQAGTILRADVALGSDNRSRGFGTVSFATEADAEHAVAMFNGYEYNGRRLKVNFDKFTQVGQPGLFTPASSTSTSPLPTKPPVHAQSGKPKLPLGYISSTTGSPSPYDIWGAQHRIPIKDERDRDFLQTFRPLDVDSLPSSTISHYINQESRPTSNSSSVKPPSLSTTTSSSSSSLGVSTSGTSEASNPPPLQQHRRPSSSHHHRHLTSESSSSTSPAPQALPLPSSSQQQRHQSSQRSPSSHHPHPHHPGPISLPPPPQVTSFPLTAHNLSPHNIMGLSPLHYPLGSPSSPLFHPSAHQMTITPHGLPPITPSMPSFNFLPPLASPTTANPPPSSPGATQHITHQPYQSYAHPLPSPLHMTTPMHMMQGGPSSPIHGVFPPPQQQQQYPHQQHNHAQQQMNPFSISPASSLSHNTHTHIPSSPNGNGSHAAPAANTTNNNNHNNMFTPGLTFSPGVVMSPGSFWGRPGGPNPMINPAVGAPVHMVHMSPGHPNMSPGHGHGGPIFYGAGAGAMREPSGYFDTGYFPPMGSLGGSGLVNEIFKDPRGGIGGSSSGDRSGNEKGEWGGDGGEDVDRAEGEGDDKLESGEEKRPGDGLGDVGESEGEGGEDVKEKGREGLGEKRVRRHSSTTATSWQSNTVTGDLRVWEGREGGDGGGGKDSENDDGDCVNNDSALETGTAMSSTLPRAHSTSASKNSGEGLTPPVVQRCDSDPVHPLTDASSTEVDREGGG